MPHNHEYAKDLSNRNSWLSALGKTIHDRRTGLGMSQLELADLAGVHRTYISDIEHGARNLTITTVHRIAIALNTSATELFAADTTLQNSAEE